MTLIQFTNISRYRFDMGNRFIQDRLIKAGIQHRRSMSSMWPLHMSGNSGNASYRRHGDRLQSGCVDTVKDDLAKVERGLPGIETKNAIMEAGW